MIPWRIWRPNRATFLAWDLLSLITVGLLDLWLLPYKILSNLASVFDSMEDLAAYQSDPRHVAVASICKAIREDRVAVDYEF